MSQLLIFVYSYKNKNLQRVIDNIYESTVGDFDIVVADQNPIDREYLFKEYKGLTYRHVYWDFLYGPIHFKIEYLLYKNYANYAIVSDDILFSTGWNERVKNFLDKKDRAVVSGTSSVSISQDDYFFITPLREKSEDFSLTQYIDRNFVFYSHEALQSARLPRYLKYYGEEEDSSARLYTSGYDIYCAPKDLYEDLGDRTIENLYVPYSLNHGYNKFLGSFKMGKFFEDSPSMVGD